ncbi:MAG TPA: hypothetical protein VH210_09185 [Gaiellaceae bacterium]|nr:hypothetical protein [Gaiellaceae bacterium]
MSVASADGDPASDVLVSGTVFTPYPPPPAAALRSLSAAVNAVELAGDRVKVAVIAKPADLGSVASLFGHPQNYAEFLSLELSFIYKGPLLVVMPAGFGFVDRTHPIPKATTALAGVSIHSPGADDLTIAAAKAMNQLERAGLLHYKDTYAPQATPSPVSVIGGRRVALRYQAWDDSGRAKVEIDVQNARNVAVARLHVPLRTVAQGAWYFVVWRAPVALSHHVLSFCVRATDRAGNRSLLVCAKLTVT